MVGEIIMKSTATLCVAVLLPLASAVIASVDVLEDIGPDTTPVTTRVIDGVTVTISTDTEPAGVDVLEDIGPDTTPVTTRVIDGVTVTISTGAGLQMQACTYYDSTVYAFTGKDGAVNAPLNPGNVSGTRFISTLGTNSRFQNVEPITFEFDQPVTSFGLTTLDLLEDEEDPTTTLRLEAFDAADALVDEQVRTGEQGPSGLDLDWSVTGTGIVKVRLTGSIIGTDIGSFGIDDLVLIPTVTAVPALDRIGLLVLIGALVTVGCTILMRRRLRFS